MGNWHKTGQYIIIDKTIIKKRRGFLLKNVLFMKNGKNNFL